MVLLSSMSFDNHLHIGIVLKNFISYTIDDFFGIPVNGKQIARIILDFQRGCITSFFLVNGPSGLSIGAKALVIVDSSLSNFGGLLLNLCVFDLSCFLLGL